MYVFIYSWTYMRATKIKCRLSMIKISELRNFSEKKKMTEFVLKKTKMK